MRFQQVSIKKKLMTIGTLIALFLVPLMINNSIKKVQFSRFNSAYSANMNQLIMSVDTDNIKETLLTTSNEQIIKKIKKTLDGYNPPKSGRELFFYKANKSDYLKLKKIFHDVKRWSELSKTEQEMIRLFVASEQIAYKMMLENSQ